jgi:hypothetical protein
MSKIMTWCTGLALAGVVAGCGQSAVAGRAGGGSQVRVSEVPGLAALNTGKGGSPHLHSVSCSSAGNCAAGGSYQALHDGQQGFVAVERDGRWAKATGVPGLEALNEGGYAAVLSVSCAPDGSCAAGGYYADADMHDSYGFVVSEENGVWGKVVTLPAGEDGEVDRISCTSAGNCVAGGIAGAEYFSNNFPGYVAVERDGRWGKAARCPAWRSVVRAGAPTSARCRAARRATA